MFLLIHKQSVRAKTNHEGKVFKIQKMLIYSQWHTTPALFLWSLGLSVTTWKMGLCCVWHLYLPLSVLSQSSSQLLGCQSPVSVCSLGHSCHGDRNNLHVLTSSWTVWLRGNLTFFVKTEDLLRFIERTWTEIQFKYHSHTMSHNLIMRYNLLYINHI